MDTGCLVSPKGQPTMQLAGTGRSGSMTLSKNLLSHKGMRNMKDLSLMDPSTLTPLKTPRAHLLAGLRTAPCLKPPEGTSPTNVPSLSSYAKDSQEPKSLKMSCCPPATKLSPKTMRGLGLPAYKPLHHITSSVSEPSTPYPCYFDEAKAKAHQDGWSFCSEPTWALPPLEMLSPLYAKSKQTMQSAEAEGFGPLTSSESSTLAYTPMLHEWQSAQPGQALMDERYATFAHTVSPYLFQNNVKKSRFGQPMAHAGLPAASQGWNTSAYEGVPYRQPRAPPPMEVLLSANEFENKNFSLRLRKQAINKLVCAGLQRKNNLLSAENLKATAATAVE